MTLRPGTGSFRDPGGRVFVDGARVLRSVYKGSADDYEAARDSGLLQELIDWNWLAASPRLGFRRRRSKRCCSALRSFVERCELRAKQTVWQGYDADNSYRGEEAERKRQLVQSMATSARPGLMYDLGCNSGDYSAAAIEAGARYVVGFDFDFGALERAVERSHGGNLPFLPLWLDATNPSPAQGWNQQERSGFDQRARGDAVIALAFIHHLAIANNIPLGAAVDWIMSIAPVGIIEFPPKSDPMVQRLLSRRADIFPDYGEEHFLAEVGRRAQIVESERLSPGGRIMVWYDRSSAGA